MAKAAQVTAEEVDRVLEAWRLLRPRPEAVRLTEERRVLVRARLRLGYSADDLVLVVRWAHEAPDEGARWLRGQHPKNSTPYLDLDNLLRIAKLGSRVEAALNWQANQAAGRPGTEESADPYRVVPAGVVLH